MPSPEELPGVGGQLLGVHGGTILVVDQPAQASLQGGVAVGLPPLGSDLGC